MSAGALRRPVREAARERGLARRILPGALVFGLVGCASALQEPPPLTELAGGTADVTPPSGPEEMAALLERAGRLFANRTLESAREAARLYLRAAAAETAPLEALLGAARAEVWITDHEPDSGARERTATAAVHAAQWCGRRFPDEPACDYWIGAALGVQARERRATALDALPRIEAAFRSAAQGRPEIEEAGPDRALALLYVRAPGWPAGPGDPELGLRHARAAAALRPDYPPNQLALAEALLANGDAAASRQAGRRALDLARDRASGGDPDAPEWIAEAEEILRKAEEP